MDQAREADQFRSMHVVSLIARAEGLITQYRANISFYRKRIDFYSRVLGHIGERLGEPEPEEP
jgi:hypothetical protein